MDFALDKKYEMAQNLFREFAQNEVRKLIPCFFCTFREKSNWFTVKK